MQINPSAKHKLIRDSVRHFAETELAPIAAEIDRNATFPLDVIAKMKPYNQGHNKKVRPRVGAVAF